MQKSARKRKRNEEALEKAKGETVPTVHPSKLQPVIPSHRNNGVTFGKILYIWTRVNPDSYTS